MMFAWHNLEPAVLKIDKNNFTFAYFKIPRSLKEQDQMSIVKKEKKNEKKVQQIQDTWQSFFFFFLQV